MHFDVEVLQEARQTRVVVTGQPSVGQLLSLLQVLALDAPGWSHAALQIDLAGTEARFTPEERLQLQHEARRHLHPVQRLEWAWPG